MHIDIHVHDTANTIKRGQTNCQQMSSLRHELTTIFPSSILQELVTCKLEAHVTVPTGSQHVTLCSQQRDWRQDGCISVAMCQQVGVL